MSANQVKGRSGRTLQITAPTGGLTAGLLHGIRSGTTDGFGGVISKGAVAGAIAIIEYGHHVQVAKITGTGESFAVGAKVYIDAATSKAAATPTGNILVGAATAAAGVSDTTLWVQLGGSA